MMRPNELLALAELPAARTTTIVVGPDGVRRWCRVDNHLRARAVVALLALLLGACSTSTPAPTADAGPWWVCAGREARDLPCWPADAGPRNDAPPATMGQP